MADRRLRAISFDGLSGEPEPERNDAIAAEQRAETAAGEDAKWRHRWQGGVVAFVAVFAALLLYGWLVS